MYEPFSGSGTTIIAAEITGRTCHAIELNPAYVDVAIRRWQEFTGETAVLEASGSSFLAVARERGVDQTGTGIGKADDEGRRQGEDPSPASASASPFALSLPDGDLRPLEEV